MARPLAFCAVHGAFPIALNFGEGAKVKLKGNRANCPRCGRTSPVQDGSFTVVNGILKLARDLPPEELRDLQKMAVAAASGGDPDAKLTKRFGFMGHLSKDDWMLILSLLTLLVTIYAALKPEPTQEGIAAKLTEQQTSAVEIVELLRKGEATNEQILAQATRIADAAQGASLQKPPALQKQPPPSIETKKLTKRRARRLRGRS